MTGVYVNGKMRPSDLNAQRGEGMDDFNKVAKARELGEEVIARSQRILALVDDYAAIPSSANRTALRQALFNEFHAAAVRDLSVPVPNAP